MGLVPQGGAGVRRVEAGFDDRRRVAPLRQAEPAVQHLQMLPRRKGRVVLQGASQQGLVDPGIVAARGPRHPCPDAGHVALLVPELALAVRLLALPGEAVGGGGRRHELVVAQGAERQVALAVGPPLLEDPLQVLDCVAPPGGALRIGGDPLLEVGLQGPLARHRGGACEAGDHPLGVLHAVVDAGHRGGVRERRLGPSGGLPVDDLELLLRPRHPLGVGPLDGLLDLRREPIAVGPPREARHHHEVAAAHSLGTDPQPVRGAVGHVSRRRIGGQAVGPDVGAVHGEVAGVAGPHPVVDVTPVLADGGRRRVHQAHVPDRELVIESILQAAVEGGHLAAVTGRGLALRDEVLLGVLEGGDTGLPVDVGRRGLHPSGDIGDREGHVHPGAGRRRQLLPPLPRQEPFLEEVALGRGVVLDGAVGTVVIGHHQPLRRDERRRAPTQGHDGAHGISGDVGKRLGRDLESRRPQTSANLRKLLGKPHALHGPAERGRSDRQKEEYRCPH